MDEGWQKTHLLFQYLNSFEKSKKLYRFTPIELDQNDGRSYEDIDKDYDKYFLFNWKKLPYWLKPGVVVEIESKKTEDNFSIRFATCALVETWKNKEDVARWYALDAAIKRQKETEDQSIKELKSSLPTDLLLPFNKAYLQANKKLRSHILAMVIETITKF